MGVRFVGIMVLSSPMNAIIDINVRESRTMPSLIVRNVDESIIRALKKRAARHGRSAEAEHRALLAEALLEPPRRTLAEVLV
ncbi:MAG: hypothetical protein IH616_24240, partial [Gemmatimonadales bacterium]|nr:hypothetical protein [Gemmatimonadales bacterium]